MILLPLGIQVSRIFYSVTLDSVYILLPDILGAYLSCILLAQYVKYRKKKTC